jgi:hypothetical protein
MELPEPAMPGWYSSKQVRLMLGNVSRQYLSQLAKKEGWGIKEFTATNHLYDVNDVQKYLISTGKHQPSPKSDKSQG